MKNENGFSENFDVLASSGHMRRGGSYFETCTPANFPVDRGDLPPAGSGCGYPYPAPIAKMNCKLHLYGPDYYTLDSTAQVGDRAYCALVGFPDRDLCPVRPENSPERVPCETWRVGSAKDTGRAGSDLDRERPVLHRAGERLREPPHQPVRAARVQDRHVHGLRQHR